MLAPKCPELVAPHGSTEDPWLYRRGRPRDPHFANGKETCLERARLSPGTAAAHLGKAAQFLLSVGPRHLLQPAKLLKRGDTHFIPSLQLFSNIS